MATISLAILLATECQTSKRLRASAKHKVLLSASRLLTRHLWPRALSCNPSELKEFLEKPQSLPCGRLPALGGVQAGDCDEIGRAGQSNHMALIIAWHVERFEGVDGEMSKSREVDGAGEESLLQGRMLRA